MTDEKIRWVQGAKAMGGLASVLTLLAHFWVPWLPLTAVRVELLLFLIGVLLGLDMIKKNMPVSIETGSEQTEGEDNDP